MNALKELYIEPTSHCNLQCAMCSRKHWKNESIGHMDIELFDKTIAEIPSSVTRIFFGGVGEPLCHPDIIYMIRRAKQTGRVVEMITNGTLLDDAMSEQIVEAKLDTLWISLDSTEGASYEDIRVGASFGGVMGNIRAFNAKRFRRYGYVPKYSRGHVKLGISFVLMKSNLGQFGKLLRNAQKLGVSEVKATHLVPYDESQINQVCYERILSKGVYSEPGILSTRVDIPFMDAGDIPGLLPFITNPVMPFSVMGTPLWIKDDYCRFVEEGVCFVRWDGEVCPCMALLHENTVYQAGFKRNVGRNTRPCSFGNALENRLSEVWESEDYAAFRQRVTDAVFSPCARCGPDMCHYVESNEADCFNNIFPTCGACLWAQGLVQCP